MGRSAASLAQQHTADAIRRRRDRPCGDKLSFCKIRQPVNRDSRNAMAMAISVAAQRADRPSYGFRGSATFGVRFGGSLGSHEASQLEIASFLLSSWCALQAGDARAFYFLHMRT
jgi:hypothetical protein